MSKLSVIIPVYNSEKYLDQCIQSILKQTYKNTEIVLVDDGSTDNSRNICLDYADKDNRIVFIEEENAGTSAARNKGLKKATGDYITFTDNDDFLSDVNAYENIMSILEKSNADILMFNTAIYDDATGMCTHSGNEIDRSQIAGKKAAEALKTVMQNGLMARAVWAKFFKAELLNEYNVEFPENMRNEDTAFTAEAFLHAKSYDWYDGIFYCYRINSGTSQTSKPMNKSQLDDLKKILMHYIRKTDELKDSELKEAMYSYLAFPFAVWLGYASGIKSIGKADFKEMKKYSYVLKYHDDSSMVTLSKLYNILGFGITKEALNLWVKFNR